MANTTSSLRGYTSPPYPPAKVAPKTTAKVARHKPSSPKPQHSSNLVTVVTPPPEIKHALPEKKLNPILLLVKKDWKEHVDQLHDSLTNDMSKEVLTKLFQKYVTYILKKMYPMVEVTRPTLEASFSNQDDEENREDKIRLFVFKLSSNNHSVFSEKIRKDKKLNTYSTGKLDQDIHNRASISGRITSYSFQKISEYLCNLYK